MTKAEPSKASRVSDLTKKHSEVIVDTKSSTSSTPSIAAKIELRGFGSFRLRQREPRVATWKIGDKVDVPPKKVPPHFQPRSRRT